MLILYCFKKFKKSPVFLKGIKTFRKVALRLGLFSAMLLFNMSYSINDKTSTQIVYNVVRNNSVIGTISVSCYVDKDSTTYLLESKINARYILRFNITGKETSVFKDNLLVYSSVFREVNKKEKANHSVVYENSQYHLKNRDGLEKLEIKRIHNNLVKLYFNEPKGEETVFCDNAKALSKIEHLGEGKYRVDISNGKYNIFHYKNGRCIKVEANSVLFNVTLIPS